jgi:hypothetical protein
MRWLVLCAALGACAARRWVVVRVAAGDGAPLAGATVSTVCPPAGQARLTGEDGEAAFEVGAAERCVVTVTRPDFATRQTKIAACAARQSCPATELRLERE